MRTQRLATTFTSRLLFRFAALLWLSSCRQTVTVLRNKRERWKLGKFEIMRQMLGGNDIA